MIQKLRRRVVAIAAAALMVTATAAPAFASGYQFHFSIGSGGGNRFDTTTDQHAKAYDNDDQWYFTPESGSWNGSICNTWAYVIYPNRPGTPSGYHNVQNYGHHSWNYQYTPAGGTELLCEVKEQSSRGYWMSGHWCP